MGIFGVLLASCAKPQTANETTYDAKEAGFSVTAPNDWTPLDEPQKSKAVVILLGNQNASARESKFAVVAVMGKTLDDSDMSGAVRSVHEMSPMDTETEPKEMSLDGARAMKVEYTNHKDGKDQKGFHVICVRHSVLYIAAFWTDPANFDARAVDAQKIIGSWKWKS